MVKAWSRPRTNSNTDDGGESRSGMHNPLVQGSNPCGPTILKSFFNNRTLNNRDNQLILNPFTEYAS